MTCKPSHIDDEPIPEEIDLPIPALLKRMAHRIRHLLFGEH